jgi:hypothetical protein
VKRLASARSDSLSPRFLDAVNAATKRRPAVDLAGMDVHKQEEDPGRHEEAVDLR